MKILYRCEKCDYQTDRLLNFKRHEQRKSPCYIKITDSVDTLVHQERTINDGLENVGEASEQGDVYINKIKCSKCNKNFQSLYSKDKHELNCDGLDKRQCKICLKVFASKYGKYEHKKYVKCNPPSTPQVVNNITNNITNNTNNTNNTYITNNNIKNIVRVNFGEECLDKICQGKDYMRKAREFLNSGKYAIPSSIEEIYFNDESVENQTIKKNRRNDKLVSVLVNGKWETRVFNDVCDIILKTTEDYFDPFFMNLQEKYRDIIQEKDGKKLMQLMGPIWRLATHITQYIGWNCKEIRKLGLNIEHDNDLDKEDQQRQKQRIKDVYTLILDKLHEKTLEVKAE